MYRLLDVRLVRDDVESSDEEEESADHLHEARREKRVLQRPEADV